MDQNRTHPHTFHSLVAWKEMLFHKAGMVLIAHDFEKIDHYIAELFKLKDAIDAKAELVRDADKVDDLIIMSDHVLTLWRHMQFEREKMVEKEVQMITEMQSQIQPRPATQRPPSDHVLPTIFDNRRVGASGAGLTGLQTR